VSVQTKKSTKKVLSTVSLLKKKLNKIIDSEALAKEAIAKESPNLREASALAELAQMDVELINADKEGIRVSALRNAGVSNIGQLHNMSLYRIKAISGIGDQTAVKIKNIANKMYGAVAESAKMQIDPTKRPPCQNIVIRNLHLYLHGEEIRATARGLLTKDVEAALKDAKPASGAIRWFFSLGTKRDKSLEAYKYLESLVQGEFSRIALAGIEVYNKLDFRDLEEIYRDFEKNAAAYYTLLEKLGLNETTPMKTGLPDDLVFAIDRYPLDLAYMKTTLRKYQVFGTKYILRQERVLLGDEMGLGKTMQALAAMSHGKKEGATHFLVVCPASVLVNWKRESDKHTQLQSTIIHGVSRDARFEAWKIDGGIGITNYESLLRLVDRLDFEYGILVVDEAHFIKNPEAQRTRALIAASGFAKRILFMTGTPLENRVDEMCFLVSCLNPEIAGKLNTMKTLSATQKFRSELAPIYLRRVRDDVLTELPELIESEDWLEPCQDEYNAYYNAVFSGNFMAMRRVSWDVGFDISSKAARLIELCDEARDDGRKIIVFSFFRDTLEYVCELLGDAAIGPITGSVSTAKRQQLVDEFSTAEWGKVLVAQVQAGGVGLNIQSASVVVFCEPQIKPSLESQAISRAYRMGQVRNVHVHRLLCVDTVDECMMNMLDGKRVEFDTYADESVIGVQSLKEHSENAWIKEVIEREKARITAIQASR